MIERFSYEKHAPLLTKWLAKRNIVMPDFKYLPDYGIVVNDCAAGFLVKTNSCVAFIENIVADPDVPFEQRDQALKIMIDELERVAKVLEFECIQVLSNLDSQYERLTSMGYGRFGIYQVFAKMLKKEEE